MVIAAVGDGVIQGAEGYVYAAYGLTWIILIIYTVSLFVRIRKENQMDHGESL